MTDLLNVDMVGYLAAILTTISFVPQALLTWKHKHADGVSLGMYLIFTAGITCWLLYGICLHATPIILANAVTLVLAGFILVMKLRFG